MIVKVAWTGQAFVACIVCIVFMGAAAKPAPAHAEWSEDLVRGLNVVVWQGGNEPPGNGQEGISAIYQWDAARQDWLFWFPNPPAGGNTLTILRTGKPYTVAATHPVEIACSFERSLPTVIAATVKLRTAHDNGGAFHIGDGYFVTVFHLMDGEEGEDIASWFWLHNSTLNVSAKLIGYSRLADVAVLQIPEEHRESLPVLKRRNSTPIDLPVASAGYPTGHTQSAAKVSRGYIVGTVRRKGGTAGIAASYEHGPGRSGAPVVDECGRVLGIHKGFWNSPYPNHASVIVDPTLSESIATILEDEQ